mmetsp:Transcript_45794/g.144011  ORF Transcript_45794/g.144011 Transcript_45794/m.144011 type:complete len:288 (+) Transcript_45794:191-1054(+)
MPTSPGWILPRCGHYMHVQPASPLLRLARDRRTQHARAEIDRARCRGGGCRLVDLAERRAGGLPATTAPRRRISAAASPSPPAARCSSSAGRTRGGPPGTPCAVARRWNPWLGWPCGGIARDCTRSRQPPFERRRRAEALITPATPHARAALEQPPHRFGSPVPLRPSRAAQVSSVCLASRPQPPKRHPLPSAAPAAAPATAPAQNSSAPPDHARARSRTAPVRHSPQEPPTGCCPPRCWPSRSLRHSEKRHSRAEKACASLPSRSSTQRASSRSGVVQPLAKASSK